MHCEMVVRTYYIIVWQENISFGILTFVPETAEWRKDDLHVVGPCNPVTLFQLRYKIAEIVVPCKGW
jgi:hypothetical protein